MNYTGLNLDGRTFCIFGLRGSGKSTFADNIARQYGAAAIVYDTTHEYPKNAGYDIYRPRDPRSDIELSNVVSAVLKKRAYKLILIDEANRFMPSKPHPLPPVIAQLNDQCRHYNIAVGYIARRLSQLNQDLTELAEYLFIYHLKGKADYAYLENVSPGLGDAVVLLPPHYFVVVYPDRDFKAFTPIKASFDWLNRPNRGVELDK